MLDALRRGIAVSRGYVPTSAGYNKVSLTEQKKRICQLVNLTHDQGLQILLAVAHIAGYEAIGTHNRGCLVDLTDWDENQVKRLSDVIQFALKQ